MTGVSVRVQPPAGAAGALDRGLVLLTHLAAAQVAAAVVHRLAGLVAGVQVEARGTRAHHALPRGHGALVAAAAAGHQAPVWGGRESRGEGR